jgi:hypothetical protein
MHFDFNNQFIKVTRTRPIFQKLKKKIIFFLLVFGVMTLDVRRILNKKK